MIDNWFDTSYDQVPILHHLSGKPVRLHMINLYGMHSITINKEEKWYLQLSYNTLHS